MVVDRELDARGRTTDDQVQAISPDDLRAAREVSKFEPTHPQGRTTMIRLFATLFAFFALVG